MERQPGLPIIEEVREFIAKLNPKNLPPTTNQPKPEQSPRQPTAAHSGHSLTSCARANHECRIADQESHIAWLAGLPDAINEKKPQTAGGHERFIADQKSHAVWLAGLTDTMNNNKRREEEADKRRAKGIGRAIMNLWPKRSSITKPAKD